MSEDSTDKSSFQMTLDLVDKFNAETALKKQKENFLYSVDGSLAASKEVNTMIESIKIKKILLEEKNLKFSTEINAHSTFITIKSQRFGFTIYWQEEYNNSTLGSILHTLKSKKRESISTFILDSSKDIWVNISKAKYSFDRNKNNENCWLNVKDEKLYTSDQIIDDCFAWLVNNIESSNRSKRN